MKKFSLIVLTFLVSSCIIMQLSKNKKSEKLITDNRYAKFEFNKYILLKTSFPGGQNENMALDLGASTILLKNSGLQFIDSLLPVLYFGKSISADKHELKNSYYKIGTIQTNAFKLTNAFLPVVPDFQTSQCNKIVGVWGADSFDGKILILNIGDSSLAVYDTMPSLNGWTLVESEFKYPHFYIYLKVNDKKIRLLFDTGSSSSVILSEVSYNENISFNNECLSEIRKYYGTAFISSSGTITDTTITAICKNSYWGSYLLDPFKITVSEKIKQNLMGMEIFKRFKVSSKNSGFG